MLEKAELSLSQKRTADSSRSKVALVKFEPGAVWKNQVVLPDSCLATGRQHSQLPSQNQYWLLLARDKNVSQKVPAFKGWHFSSTPPFSWLPEVSSSCQYEKLLTAEG